MEDRHLHQYFEKRSGPALDFSNTQTAQPLYGTISLPGGTSIGNGFASFLLGYFDSASIGNELGAAISAILVGLLRPGHLEDQPQADTRLRHPLRSAEAGARIVGPPGFLPSGHRQSQRQRQARRRSLRGPVQLHLASTYPYAVAPRIGVAYQIDPKTVLRAGWGFSYSTVNNFGYIGGATARAWASTPSTSRHRHGNNGPAGKMSDGLHWNSDRALRRQLQPGLAGTSGAACRTRPPTWIPTADVRRASTSGTSPCSAKSPANLVVEAAYVGNRGVWFQNNASSTTTPSIPLTERRVSASALTSPTRPTARC